MNFFPNNMMTPFNDLNINSIFNRINEIENRIRKLEQRIIKLENELGRDSNNNEPDNSLYMI